MLAGYYCQYQGSPRIALSLGGLLEYLTVRGMFAAFAILNYVVLVMYCSLSVLDPTTTDRNGAVLIAGLWVILTLAAIAMTVL